MSKSQDTMTQPEDEATSKGGKKKLILLALVAALVVGAAAWFFLLAPSPEAEAPIPGAVLALEPIAVNLAGGGYLKVGIALQLVEGAGGEKGVVDGTKATDLLISIFSQADPATVTASRQILKADLQAKIIEAYHGEVLELYFIEYVTQ